MAGRNEPDAEPGDDDSIANIQRSIDARAQYVEIAIEQAIRRGDFDRLPGAGQPLTGLGGVEDPDWWIRRKIKREQLRGLGPPALTLRTEDAELDDRIDGITSEREVREHLEDFNRRIVEARRQLQGGPPVVTRLRAIDDEIEQWKLRRTMRAQALAAVREHEAAELAALSRRERRARRRRTQGGP